MTMTAAVAVGGRSISSSSSVSCRLLLHILGVVWNHSSICAFQPPSLLIRRRGLARRRRHSQCTKSNMSNTTPPNLVVDPFCFRQFQEKRPKITTEDAAGNGYTGTIFDISIADFEKIVNKRYREEDLQEGYAPFCKHLFVTNDFTNAVVNVLPITPENEGLLRTKYEARNEKELPVLVRFFPKELQRQQQQLPKAKYLDLILYSREQIQKENEAQQQQQLGDAMSSSSSSAQAHAALPPLSPWGIVSIKAQDLNRELPMNPITVMRNALGKEHGGSGIPLDRKAYLQAVDYWNNHAVVADT